jgi:hypothetical protein
MRVPAGDETKIGRLRRRTPTGKGFSEREERCFLSILISGRRFALSMVQDYSNPR